MALLLFLGPWPHRSPSSIPVCYLLPPSGSVSGTDLRDTRPESFLPSTSRISHGLLPPKDYLLELHFSGVKILMHIGSVIGRTM
jgi:hypothetical protein